MVEGLTTACPHAGALAYRKLDDGRELTLYPGIMGTVRVCIGGRDGVTYDDAWCFVKPSDGIAAVEHWDGEGDPPGPWFRNIGTGRRREHDASGRIVREYVLR